MASVDKSYDELKAYLVSNKYANITDDILLKYFKFLSIYTKSSILIAKYQFLTAYMQTSDNVDISTFIKLKEFIDSKKSSAPKKQEANKLLTMEEVDRFVESAPNKHYLLQKIVAAFAIAGNCTWNDLMLLHVTDVVNYGTEVIVSLRTCKKKFVLPQKYYSLYKTFASLRPTQKNLQFFYQQSGKECTDFLYARDFAKMAPIIAKYLKLPLPNTYNGFCKYPEMLKDNIPTKHSSIVEVVMDVEVNVNNDVNGDKAFGVYVANIFDQLPDDKVKPLKCKIDNIVDEQVEKYKKELDAMVEIIEDNVNSDCSNSSKPYSRRKRRQNQDKSIGTDPKKIALESRDVSIGKETVKENVEEENILLNEIDSVAQTDTSENKLLEKRSCENPSDCSLNTDSDFESNKKNERTKSTGDKSCKHGSASLDKNSFLCGKISSSKQKEIKQNYSNLKTFQEQENYVRDLIKINFATNNYSCYLPSCDGLVKVCKFFFMSTLGIDNSALIKFVEKLLALEKRVNIEKCSKRIGARISKISPIKIINSKNDICKSEQISDKFNTYFKCSEKIQELLEEGSLRMNVDLKKTKAFDICKQFFDGLPKLDLHVCKGEAGKIYLEQICEGSEKMQKVYLKWLCRNKNSGLMDKAVFNEVWGERNYSIYEPRKEVCSICATLTNSNIRKSKYIKHFQKKTQAQRAVHAALDSMRENSTFVINVDIQTVFPCPKLEMLQQFHEHKLNIYNFIIYCYNSEDVSVYSWDESNGEAGQNEFASCLTDYLEKKITYHKKVVIISDSCSYHNRNQILRLALHRFSVKKSIIIEQIILENGHSLTEEMKNVILTLEKELRPDICSFSDYISKFKKARPDHPFEIHPIDYKFFKNFASGVIVSDAALHNVGLDIDIIRGFLYKDELIYYKMQLKDQWLLFMDGVHFKEIAEFKRLYPERRKISKSKYMSLQRMKKYIHSNYHQFYDDLSYYSK